MTTVIEYKGSTLHRREISRKQLETSGVEFAEGDTLKTMVWEKGPHRRPVRLGEGLSESTIDQIVDLLSSDKSFSIKNDDGVVSEADEEAGHILPDGSNAADGTGGSETLAESIRMNG